MEAKKSALATRWNRVRRPMAIVALQAFLLTLVASPIGSFAVPEAEAQAFLGNVVFTKSGPSTVRTGENITYTINLFNNYAGGPFMDLTVTDPIPSGLTLVSAPGCSQEGNSVVCRPGPVHQSESKSFTLTFSGVQCGKMYRNAATVSGVRGQEGGAAPYVPFTKTTSEVITTSEQCATQQTDIAGCPGVPHPNPTQLTAGQSFGQYKITWQNNGTSTWRASQGYSLGFLPSFSNVPSLPTLPQSVALPHDVAPGQRVEFTFPVSAGNTAGDYVIVSRMMKNGQQMPTDLCGGPMKIVPAAPTCTSPLSYAQVQDLVVQGKIVIQFNKVNGTASIQNNTDCSFPAELAVYKMFDPLPKLSTQQFVSASGVKTVPAKGSASFQVNLPDCRYQMDLFYGAAPRVLEDSQINNYQVMTFGIGDHLPYCAVPQTDIPECVDATGADQLIAGQQGTVTIRYRNKGTSTWQPNTYALARVDLPNVMSLPGFNGASLLSSVPPDNIAVFTIPVTAPQVTQQTTFAVVGRMTKNGQNIGDQICGKSIVVKPAPTPGAQCPYTTQPVTINNGQTHNYSIVWKNTGNTTWRTADGYRLEFETTHQGYTVFPNLPASLPIPHDVAPGQEVTFTFPISGPAGDYVIPSKITRNGQRVGTDVCGGPVRVLPPAPVDIAECPAQPPLVTLQPGQTHSYSLTWKNAGTSTWRTADGYRLEFHSDLPPHNVLPGLPSSVALPHDVAPGQTVTFTFPITASAAGDFVVPSKMVRNGQKIGTVVCAGPVRVLTPTTDLSVQKTGPAVILKGQAVQYTVTVTNHSSTSVPSFTVTDEIPAGFTYSNYHSDFISCQQSGNNVVCNGANLGAGQSRSFTLTFQAGTSLQCNSTVINRVRVSTTVQDTNASNDTATAQSTVDCPVTTTTLEIQKRTDPANQTQVDRGQTLSYILRVRNAGTIAATNVSVNDVFPYGLQYNAAASDSACRITAGTVTCDGFNLSAGEAREFRLVFTVPAIIACGTNLQNTATAIAGNAPQVTSNTVSTGVRCGPAALTVTKETNKTTAARGESVTYTLRVMNNGELPAQNVVLTDQMPSGMEFEFANDQSCSLNGNTVGCNLGTLQSGANYSIILRFKVSQSAQCNGTLVNYGTASAIGIGGVNSNQVFTNVLCNPANVTIQKYVDRTEARSGDLVRYKVTVRNNGETNAQNVLVVDPLPSQMFLVDYSATSGQCSLSSDDSTVRCSFATLRAQESADIYITARVKNGSICGTTADNSARVYVNDVPGSTSNHVMTLITCGPAQFTFNKSVNRGTVMRGETIQYQIFLQNTGESDAQNVMVEDQLPSSLRNITATTTNGTCAVNGNVLRCELGTVVRGNDPRITISAQVRDDAVCNGAIVNTATLTATGLNAMTTNQVSTTVQCQPASLVLEKSGPATVQKGSTLGYTITVRNAGASPATNVVIGDQVPQGLSFMTGECSLDGNVVLCGVGTLNPGASRTFALNFSTVNATCGATILNRASVAAANLNVVHSNQVSTTVQCAPSTLAIQKAVDRSTAQKDEIITYALSVTKTGELLAQNVTVTDTVPAGLQFEPNGSDSRCSLSSSFQVLCNLGTVSNNQHVTLKFRVKQDAVCNSTIYNTASVSASGISSVTSNQVSTQVSCPQPTTADLSVQKVGPATVSQNGTLSHTITVTNHGPATAQNVVVQDQIPAGLTFQGVNQNGFTCAVQGSAVRCEAASLPSGESRELVLSFSLLNGAFSCGQHITNNVSVTSSTQDLTTSNNFASAQTQVQCSAAGLAIQKAVDRATAQRGDLVTYGLSVSKTGEQSAQNVTVTDVIPTGLTFESSGSDSRCSATSSQISCDLGTVTSSQNLTLKFRVKNDAVCGSTVTNTATVSASSLNPVTSNQVSTQVVCSSAALVIQKAVDRATVQRDELVTYAITVGKTGELPAQNVTVTDTVPTGLTFEPSGSDNRCSLNGSTVSCDLGTVTSNQSLTLKFRVRQDAACSSVITNTATVSASGLGSVTSNQVSTTVQCQQQPTGCIEILKEAFDPNNNRLNTVPQFTFKLDNNLTVQNNSQGVARYEGVPVGQHTVTEVSQSGWENFLVTPTGGTVNVTAGSSCVGVVFKNRQVLTGGMAITKTDGRTTVQPGETLTYSITVTNSTNAAATVTVTDQLPSQVQYQSSSDNGSISGNTVTWANVSIPTNGQKTLTVQVRVRDDASAGTVLTNTAQIQNGPTATDTTVVQTSGGTSYRVTINDNPDPVRPNENLRYETCVTNQTGTPGTVTVRQTLDNRTEFRSASHGGYRDGSREVVWTNQSFSANETRCYNVDVRVDEDTRDGDVLTSTATAGNGYDSETTRVEDEGSDEIDLEIVDDPDPVKPCEDLEYTIRLINRDDRDATVTLVADLDDQTEFDDASDGGDEISNNRVEWRNIRVDGDDEEEVTLTVTVDCDAEDGDELRLRARAGDASDTEDTDVIEEEVAGNPPPSVPGTIRFEKTADRYDAQPGDEITYTLTVRNNTDEAMQNIRIVDTFNASQLLVQMAEGGQVVGGSLTFELGTLEPGSSRTIRYTGQANSSLRHGDIIVNTATMTSSKGSQTASVQVRILQQLPQTGSEYTGPLQNARAFLRPISSSSSAGSVPAAATASMAVSMIGAVGYFARRFFL